MLWRALASAALPRLQRSCTARGRAADACAACISCNPASLQVKIESPEQARQGPAGAGTAPLAEAAAAEAAGEGEGEGEDSEENDEDFGAGKVRAEPLVCAYRCSPVFWVA